MAQTHYKQQINAFAQSLRQEERAQGTIENYLRHLRAFAAWLGGGEDACHRPGLESGTPCQGICARDCQRHACTPKPFHGFSGLRQL